MFNNALLMAAAASGDTLVQVGNSALYTTSSQELERTPGSTGNVDKFTFSAWVYMCNPTSGTTPIFGASNTSANQQRIFTNSSGTLQFDLYLSNSYVGRLITTQVLRDIGWYHIVAVYDSGNGIAGNRQILYLNGVRITDLATQENVSVNQDGLICGANLHQIGMHDGLGVSMDGYMAEAVLLDGTVADPSSFGQYDSTGTFWTPKSSEEIKALTFGTTGFYLDNTTNAQTDASGEGNNFTNTGSVALSTHTPTNINTLMNPLSMFQGMSLENGNNKVTFTAAAYTGNIFTIPIPPTGKWKMEVDMTAITGGLIRMGIIEKTEYSPKNMTTNVPFDHDNFGNPDFNTISTSGGNASAIGKVDGTAYSYASEANGSRVVSNGDRWAFYYDADSGKFWAANDDGSGDTTYFYEDSGGTAGNPATGSNPLATSNTSKSYQFYVTGYSDPTANRNFLFKEEADWILTTPTGYAPLTTTNIAAETTRTKSNLEEYFDTTLYEGNGAIQRVGQFLPFTNSFTVANSALFNAANEEYFSRTFETPTDQDVWSLSWWMKTGNLGDIPRGIIGGATHNKDLIYVTPTAIYVAFNGVIDYQIDVYDPASFHHYYLTNNSGTLTFYIDGVSQGTASAPTQTDFNSAVAHTVGAYNGDANWFDGYMSQFVFVDGTVIAVSAFGQVDTSTGRWVPKDVTTTLDEASDFGNNGFFLNFANSSDMGNDVSGNNHDFTNNNTVVQVDDSPTVNIATLNPNDSAGATFSNGNKSMVTTGSSNKSTRGTIKLPNTGKYYWESNLDVASSASIGQIIGLEGADQSLTTGNTAWTDAVLMNKTNSGSVKINGADLFTTSGVAAINTKFQIAVDLDNNKMWFGVNNSWFNSAGGTDGNPSTGANPTISQDFSGYAPLFGNFNCQQTVRFDSADWTYTQPTGYVSLTQDSLPTGESYQTAFSWIKNRDATDNHMLFDRVRGIYNDMHSNASSNQVTNVNTLQRFLNGGVQVGSDVEVNTANESYVAWNWYMETAGSGTSNTDGTINTTATLVDTNIGLSISQFTGTGSNATIGHGLGVVPQMYWVKGIDGGDHWYVYHANNTAAPQTDALLLNGNGATFDDVTLWNDTAPTSSLISLGSSTGVNQSSKKYLAMAFGPSQFTSIGSYVGNGNANGSFVPTINSLGIPLKVQWVMIKRTDAANSWQLTDTVRTPNNASSLILQAQLSNAELDNSDMDNVTGGFKLRSTDNIFNSSGGTYVYLAFGTPMIDVDGRIITGR